MKPILFILITLISFSTYAKDIRSYVISSDDFGLSNKIDPNEHIFGIPLGTTENAFIEKYGNPTGYVQLNKSLSGMLYGKSHFFFFEENKLSGFKTGHSILDWEISQEIMAHTPFDNINWALTNGIKKEMSLTGVKQILKDKLITEGRGYKRYFLTENSKVSLSFSHYVDSGENDEAYTLHSILIESR